LPVHLCTYAVAEMPPIEPDLTKRKLRAWLTFMHDVLWPNLSEV
jgi:hypothetical protein